MVLDKSLFQRQDEIQRNRSRRGVRKSCAYYKDIGRRTIKCNALKDEIERLIHVGHLKKFLEDEPQVGDRNERLRQRTPERIREVLTIIGGPHLGGETRNARDRNTKEA